jgi:hypothetical protein
LILSVAPAVKNLKPWSWAVVNRLVRTVKVKILKSRCLFLRSEVVVPLHPEVRAVGQDVQTAPVPTAAAAIKFEEAGCHTATERESIKTYGNFYHEKTYKDWHPRQSPGHDTVHLGEKSD